MSLVCDSIFTLSHLYTCRCLYFVSDSGTIPKVKLNILNISYYFFLGLIVVTSGAGPRTVGTFTLETALYSPPSSRGARHVGRSVLGGKDRRGERKGDVRMRSDRDERGER